MSERICELPGCGKSLAGKIKRAICCSRAHYKKVYDQRESSKLANRKNNRKWYQSENGKAKQFAASRRWRRSEKGRKYQRLADRKRQQSDKGREQARARLRRWAKTEKGKMGLAKQAARRTLQRSVYYTLKLLALAEQASQVLEKAIMELPQKELQELEDVRAKIKEMSTDDLKHMLAAGMRITREWFLNMGVGLVELEARGEKPEINSYMDKFLRRIGDGKVLVDAVVRFAGSPYTLASVTALSVEEQLKVMQEDNATVAARFHPGGRSRRSPKQPAMPDIMPLVKQAMNATAKDLAGMIMDMIEAHPEPGKVAEELLPRLQRVKNGPYQASAARLK